ncbi:MAG: DUF1492 domain-containing protein [Clostridiales bacterium]|nr:DUF1492 domain-containing protein [Clostridiales bacterium]
MTAKEYLNQLRHLDNRINQQLRELADLRTTATSIGSMDYSKTRVQSGGGGHAAYTDIVHHIAALEAEINAEVDRYIDEKHTIIRQIQTLKNPAYVEILYKRYVEYKRLEEIAVEMNYSYDHVRRLHGWALQDFERCHTMPHSPVVE